MGLCRASKRAAMRLGLLELLACSLCYGRDFSVAVHEEDSREIRVGKVDCKGCGAASEIEEGILNTLGTPTDIVRAEIAGNALVAKTERSSATDEWLLGLPRTYAEYYSDKDESWQNEEKEVRALVELVDPKPGDVVLDLGAGTSWTTDLLARRGCCAIAIDVSTEKYVGLSSSDVYMKHHGSYYERVVADMSSRLPFNDSRFDVIFAFSAVHHAPDVESTFREVARLLKPSGSFALVEATRGMLESRNRFGLREREQYGLNEHKYSLREYQRLATATCLSLQVYPAPSFFAKMDGLQHGSLRVPGPLALKHRIGKIMARTFWKHSRSREIATQLYPLLCHLIGMQMLVIARKASPASGVDRS